jgi:hypothetical protein
MFGMRYLLTDLFSSNVLRAAVMSFAIVTLQACSTLAPTVSFSEQELQAKLEKRFPMQKRLLGAVDATLTQPKLTLRPGVQAQPKNGRVHLDAVVLVSTSLSSKTAKGQIELSTIPAISRERRALVATDLRVEKLSFDSNAVGSSMEPVTKALNSVLKEALADWVLVEFDNVAQGTITKWLTNELDPGAIRVERDRVSIDFVAREKR